MYFDIKIQTALENDFITRKMIFTQPLKEKRTRCHEPRARSRDRPDLAGVKQSVTTRPFFRDAVREQEEEENARGVTGSACSTMCTARRIQQHQSPTRLFTGNRGWAPGGPLVYPSHGPSPVHTVQISR
jgi:hypothetical protein